MDDKKKTELNKEDLKEVSGGRELGWEDYEWLTKQRGAAPLSSELSKKVEDYKKAYKK